MSELLLGPLLRHVGETDATVWVETSAACEVEVLGCSDRTFEVLGHHFALVHVTGLEPGSRVAYKVHLDGERVWPFLDGWPASMIRPVEPDSPQTIAFGSCRVGYPHEEPFSLTKDEHPDGREVDALLALALRLRDCEPDDWPELLLMLGDQVYADEVSPTTCAFIESRRDPAVPPGYQVSDFAEYRCLYHESWGQEHMRWLLSCVPSAMIFDDHDVHDDWNTSDAWVRMARAEGWWDRRIVGGFASYYVYQHLGNLPPEALADDATWQALRAAEGDAWPVLREFGWWADREVAGTRWSFRRDVGRTRIVMVDSRAGRVLGRGRRSMVDPGEWDWIERHATGDVDHLLIGTSLPLFLLEGLHWMEAWNEAVCDGAWGEAAAEMGEKIRQGADLEHWAAFGRSFERMGELLREVAAGRRGSAPGSIVVLSGDVHHAYLAEVGFKPGSGVVAPVWQAVCSPFRNPLARNERRAIRAAASPLAGRIARSLARAAGVGSPPVGWRMVHDEPWFDNQVGTLRLEGRRARLKLEKVSGADPELHEVFSHELA
jgi:hypothetical protein